MDMYKVEYSEQFDEWQIQNDHTSCSAAGFPYTPYAIYGFDTKDEAEECAAQLRKWHSHSTHVSHRREAILPTQTKGKQ